MNYKYFIYVKIYQGHYDNGVKITSNIRSIDISCEFTLPFIIPIGTQIGSYLDCLHEFRVSKITYWMDEDVFVLEDLSEIFEGKSYYACNKGLIDFEKIKFEGERLGITCKLLKTNYIKE